MIRKIYNKIKFELRFNNTRYYRRLSDKVLKTYYQKVLAKKIHQLRPINVDSQNPKLTLATFANKKRFFESVAALYSFCFWESDLNIHYHEDGTLEPADIELLKKIFPGITVFLKSEQNLQTKEFLSARKLNNCIYLRDNFIFGIKLFDMVIEKKTNYLLHIDSDVLFLDRPAEIIDIINEQKLNGCFNQDPMVDMYSFNEATLAKHVSKPMLRGFNSGLLLHNFDTAFFNFVDDVMEGETDKIASWHLEQTLLAMYASAKGDFAGLPKTYDILSRHRNAGNKIVSEHYTHNTGYQMHKDFIYTLYPLFTASKIN